VTDAVIVGAGIVGAACADALADEGLSVTVVDSGIPGGGTTAGGMGHLTVMDDSEAQFALTRYSVDLWRSMDLPPRAEFLPCGTLWVAADDEEMAEVRRKQAFLSSRVVASEVLDSRALAEAEPNLRRGLAGALFVPCDAILYQPLTTRHLLRRAKFVSGEAIRLRDDGVDLRDGSRLSAAVTVNAAGVGAPKLTAGLDIQPRKGHLLITDRYPGFVRHALVELGYLKNAHASRADSVAFNVQPRVTGQVLIGSSRQLGATSPDIEPRMLGWMLQRAASYLPDAPRLNGIRTWTGLRPCTPDNLPYIGLVPGTRSTYVAAGHEGLGITSATGTAKLIASLATGRKPPIPVEPYALSREMVEHV